MYKIIYEYVCAYSMDKCVLVNVYMYVFGCSYLCCSAAYLNLGIVLTNMKHEKDAKKVQSDAVKQSVEDSTHLTRLISN